ncbi:MAG: hypothetical protein P8Z80_00015 [Pseudolabrys sp.]
MARLVLPEAPEQLNWTLSTNLQEIRGHEEEFKRRDAHDPHGTHDFGAENWLNRREQTRAYRDREPTVLSGGVRLFAPPCPALCRASASFKRALHQDVDGRDIGALNERRSSNGYARP